MTGPRRRRWALRWHGWLSAVLASFAALEFAALRDGGEDATLSAHLRRTLGVSPWCRRGPAGRVFMFAVFGWCAVHLCLGRWPSPGWFDPDGIVD